MIQYKNWSPSQFDGKGLHADMLEISEFYVLPILHQPKLSGQLINKANFDSALKMLGGESEKVQVLYFGHWTSNFEIIVVHPDLIDKVQKIESALANYPILDDDYFSQLEYEAATDVWNNVYSYQDKKAFCIKYDLPVNEARRKFENVSAEVYDSFRMYECNEL